MRTIVIMVSVGNNRKRLTDYSFNRLYKWASKHNYSCVLLKNDINYLDRTPHFTKLIAHKQFPNFERYIIVDDDILISEFSPAIENVPKGFVGLCMDSVQSNTQNPDIKWTANTGFIVADSTSVQFLEKAYENGQYPFNCGDGTNKGIWGPFDQAITNFVLFKNKKIFKLDPKWNTQIVIEFYTNDKGWHHWCKKKLYRIGFYLSLLTPFSKNRQNMKSIYGLHMTMGPYPKFFNFIFR